MKRSFFLLEILITLTLMMVILSALFMGMGKGIFVEKKTGEIRSEFLQRGSLHARLQDLFLSIDASKPLIAQPKRVLFFSDFGIDPDPLFNGTLPVTLHVDPQKNLVLSRYSQLMDQKKRKCRQEILASKIDQWSLQCLDLNGKWLSLWSQEKNGLPEMVRLTFTKQDARLSFAFQVP
jgi:hypothetical protein